MKNCKHFTHFSEAKTRYKRAWGYFVILNICACVSACTYDNELDLYGTITCSTDNMSYSEDILPIITTNCYQCHDAASNFGNVTIEGYESFIEYVNAGTIIGVITHSPGFPPMPSNMPKLLDCEIAKVQSWIEQGALNN